MEYTNKKQIENLLRLQKFHDLRVQVSVHSSLNTCKGVVRCPDLKGEMREQDDLNVRRIKVRHDGTLKDTNTFVFTFNTSALPKQLKVAFLCVSVDPYIPNPLRCYSCQVFGHHENKGHREEICANCGQAKHSADGTDCKRPPKWGWSGGAMVLGKLPVPGRPTIWITVGQGPTALVVGAGGGCLDIFTLVYPCLSSFSLSLGDGPI